MEFFAANIQLREVFVQLLAFVIVFWFLKSKVWKTILTALEARRHKIESGFREIDQTKQELASLKTNYDLKLAHIEEETRAKLAEAIQEGKKLAREIQEAARKQAKEILDKSKEDIGLETAKARVVLRKEIAGLVSQATEHLVREKITNQKDEEMILRFIKELEESKEKVVSS